MRFLTTTLLLLVALLATACGGDSDGETAAAPPDDDAAADDADEGPGDLPPGYLTMSLTGQFYAADFVLCVGVPPGGTIINASSTDPDDPTDLYLLVGEEETLEIKGADRDVRVDAELGDEFDVVVDGSSVTGVVVIRSIPELAGERIEIQGQCE